MINQLLEKLNPQQAEAVAYGDGPLLVLAGAGSGKTRVLTHRIAYCLQQGAQPEEILAVTFTNKAAKEMKSRVLDLTGLQSQGTDLWMGTFHSLCVRILRRYVDHYQPKTGRTWTSRFVIYDQTESQDAMKTAVRELELDDKLYSPKNIRYMVSELKNRMIDAYAYGSSATDFRSENMARIFDTYEAILARNNAVDFDDLLLMATRILQDHEAVRTQYHTRFKHMLVDEFQDTNDVQYEWIRLLAENCKKEDRVSGENPALWKGRSLTVVGDVDQSIYSWRGANFRICLNFQNNFPEATLIKLEENYRSTANILKTANAIIENNADRLPKELRAVRGEGSPVYCYEASDDRDEANFVIDRIQAVCRETGRPPGDCAILYRTNVQSRALEDVLISRGVSYTMIGGLKFYERREIRDMLAYLTVLFNPQDSYSVKRILNVPTRGIGRTSIEHVEQAAAAQDVSFYAMLQRATEVEALKPKALKAIASFVAIMDDLASRADLTPIDELILHIIERTGYLDELRANDPSDSEGRVANVEELMSVCRQFMIENTGADLADFLTQMALLSDIDTAEPVENKLVLMTLHAAKGLEYPIVFLVGLEEGLFPHSRSLSDNDGMEEERRLMYVGVTRAEERLFLTYARRRMVFGELKYAAPSRFLKEIPATCMTGLYNLDSEARVADKPGGRRGGSTSGYNAGATGMNTGSSTVIRRSHGAQGDAAKLMVPQAGAGPKQPTFTGTADTFATGERVRHPRFGEGVIEQVIASENKALYNIQFDKIEGKKLLNPKYVKLEKL